VQQVRAAAPPNRNPYLRGKDPFWTGFDAYSNAATGSVESTAVNIGSVQAGVAFRKCLVTRGLYLGPESAG